MAEWKAGKVDGIPFDSGFGGFLANIGIVFIAEVIHRTLLARRISSNDNVSQTIEHDVGPEMSEDISVLQPKWDIPVTARFGEVNLINAV